MIEVEAWPKIGRDVLDSIAGGSPMIPMVVEKTSHLSQASSSIPRRSKPPDRCKASQGILLLGPCLGHPDAANSGSAV